MLGIEDRRRTGGLVRCQPLQAWQYDKVAFAVKVGKRAPETMAVVLRNAFHTGLHAHWIKQPSFYQRP